MKHTPGPWKVYKGLSREGLTQVQIFAEDGTKDGRNIAELDKHGVYQPEDKRMNPVTRANEEDVANANLIALAPEMYDVLQDVAETLYWHEEAGHFMPTGKEGRLIRDIVEEILYLGRNGSDF